MGRARPARRRGRCPAPAARWCGAGPRSRAPRTGSRPGVPLEVEIEAVLPGAVWDGARLQLGEVDPAPAEQSQHLGQRARAVGEGEEERGAGRRLGGNGMGWRPAPRNGCSSPPASGCRGAGSPGRRRGPRTRRRWRPPWDRCARAPCGPSRRCRTRPGRWIQGTLCRNSWHWSSPWGWERTVRRSSMRAPGSAEQAVLDVADLLGGDGEAPLGQQVVGLVDAAGGGVLDRQQGAVGGAALHRLGGGAEGLEPLEQHALGEPGVAALGGEMAVGPLDSLVGHPQGRRRQRADVGLLVGHRHLEQHPVEPLHLMGVEPALHGRVAHPLEDLVLAQRIAERRSREQLGRRHLLDQVHAPAQMVEDLVVDLLDRFAQGLEVWRSGHGRER